MITFGEWWVFSPKTQLWAQCNESMANMLIALMTAAPKPYEGWKVAFVQRPQGFVFVHFQNQEPNV